MGGLFKYSLYKYTVFRVISQTNCQVFLQINIIHIYDGSDIIDIKRVCFFWLDICLYGFYSDDFFTIWVIELKIIIK